MGASAGIGSQIRRLIPASIGSFLVRPGTARIEEQRWDDEYATGKWSNLDSLFEMPRYAVIAGYCRRTADQDPVSVLDIGCGNGLLHHWLSQDGVAGRYLGVDMSSAAIDQARERVGPGVNGQARFLVGDAEYFTPEAGERFDVIVLNEMLYYLDYPEKLVERCADFLAPGGVILLSMWRSPRALATWRRAAPLLDVQDEVRLRRTRDSGGRPTRKAEWHIRLCRLRTA